MSKAFTKDDAPADSLIVPRRPLPDGVPNYVTARGLAALRAEKAALDAERTTTTDMPALAAKIAELDARLASARLVEPTSRDDVRFGATVTVLDSEGHERRYRIVGVDEADARRGMIAFVAPLARALLGKKVGDEVVLKTPAGDEELEIASIDYVD